METNHSFYYDKRKCFLYGLLLISAGSIFRPFTLLLYGGAGGVIIALLTFWWSLIPGLNYFLKCLVFAPALYLAPSHVEVDSFYKGRQRVKWNDIQEIEYEKGPGALQIRLGGFPVQVPFPMEENYVAVRTNNGERYKIRLDALKLQNTDIEELLRNYKRLYYFQSR